MRLLLTENGFGQLGQDSDTTSYSVDGKAHLRAETGVRGGPAGDRRRFECGQQRRPLFAHGTGWFAVTIATLATAACGHPLKMNRDAKAADTSTSDLRAKADLSSDGNAADKDGGADGAGVADTVPDTAMAKDDVRPDAEVGQRDVPTADATPNVPVDAGAAPQCTGTLLLGASLPLDQTWGEPVALRDLNGDGNLDLITGRNVLFGTGDGRFSGRLDSVYGNAVADLNGDGALDIVAANTGSGSVSVMLGKGDGTFLAKADYDVGLSQELTPYFGRSTYDPTAVVLGDVNGDGKLDIATANFDSSTVSVLLGKGNGTFAARADYPTGLGPTSLALGDVNGDGRTDLVTVNYSAVTLSVMLGLGDGTFAAKQDHPIPIHTEWPSGAYQPTPVVLGDLNGDGKLDLVVPDWSSNIVNILLGQGDGTFAASVYYATGERPESVLLVDLKGDGKLDLVVANVVSDSVSVLLGRGDGTFAAKQDYPAADMGTVAVGDVNGDGKLDLAAGIGSVLFGKGDGTFVTSSEIYAGPGPTAVAVRDLNGDGKLDLVTVSSDSDTASVLLGTGNGTFAASVDYPTGDGPKSVAIGDVNGDGKLDLATVNTNAGTVTVLLGKGDGTFATQQDVPSGSRPVAIALGDLNGDGTLDIVTAGSQKSGSSRGTVSVLLGTGDGRFAAEADYESGEGTAAVAIGDMNGDGKPDLVVGSAGPDIFGALAVWLGNGDGTFKPGSTYPSSFWPRVMALGDLNGDGSLDVVAENAISGSAVSVLLGKGDGSLEDKVDYQTTGEGSVALGDMNGDGKLDIVTDGVTILFGNGDGTFAGKTNYLAGKGPAVIGDVNGDGRLDVVKTESGAVRVLLGACLNSNRPTDAGVGTADARSDEASPDGDITRKDAARDSSPRDSDVGSGGLPRCPGALRLGGTLPFTEPWGQTVALADLDGDGRLDLISENGISRGKGDGTFATSQDYPIKVDLSSPHRPYQPTAIAVADMNGDGKRDLIVVEDGQNTIHVLLGKGDGSFSATYAAGTDVGPLKAVVLDLNADGQRDVAVVNYFADTVSVYLGQGDGTLGARVDYPTGKGPIAMALGDLNGDGKPDVVTVNSHAGSLSVLLGAGDGTFAAAQDYPIEITLMGSFQSGPYHPTPVELGDVNGDGKLDLVLANHGTSLVSVLLGKGDGTFAANVDYATGSGPFALLLLDLDRDGKLDVVTANQIASSVSILVGKGDGTFAARQDYSTAEHPTSVAAGDLNGDGMADLALSSGSVLFGRGDGTFHSPAKYPTGAYPVEVALGDLNGDGRPDLVTANNGASTVSVLLATGEGRFAVKQDFPTGEGPYALALGDLNRDGKLDLVSANFGADSVSVLLGTGNGNFAARQDWPTGQGPGAVVLGDFDGDGRLDIATAGAKTLFDNGVVSLLLGKGDGTFAGKLDVAVGVNTQSLALGDLDRDGKLDLVTANSGTDVDGSLSVLFGKGGGRFSTSVDYASAFGPGSVALGDLNGDGILDLVAANAGGGDADAGKAGESTVSVLLGQGDGSFAAKVEYVTGDHPLSVALGDLNGDGKLDVVTPNRDSPTVSVLFGNGDGTLATKVDYPAVASSLALGDLNGDGMLDVTLTNGNAVDVLLGSCQ